MSIAHGIGDPACRTEDGVRRRQDGKTTGWNGAHRHTAGRWAYMTDIDGLSYVTVVEDTEEQLFIEYAPDELKRYGQIDRLYAFIAMFERKRTRDAAWKAQFEEPAFAARLEMCRRLGVGQALPMRAFFVIGEDVGPWTIHEIDTATGAFDRNAGVPIAAGPEGSAAANMGRIWTLPELRLAHDRQVHIDYMRKIHKQQAKQQVAKAI